MSSRKKAKTSASTTPVNHIQLCTEDDFVISNSLAPVVAQLVFTDSVSRIQRRAFINCPKLVQVIFPQTLIRIGNSAFYKCTSLQEADLSNTCVDIIEESTFSDCSSLKKISFPTTLTTIEPDVFSNCILLEEIDIAKTAVTSLKNEVFKNCKALKKVSFPPTLSEIGKFVCHGCNSLIVVDLSKTRTQKIGDSSFSSCNLLEYVNLPDTLQSMHKSAFKGCRKLSIIAIPDHVHIPFDSFKRCTLIKEVKEKLINNSVSVTDGYQFLHDQHRFAKLSLHQVCYNPNLTFESLTTNITTAITNETINNVDMFSLNALHILCMNPNVTPHMISRLVKAHPSLRTMKSMVNMTPLMMYLRLKGILGNHVSITPNTVLDPVRIVRFVIKNGVDWDIMECIIEFDDEIKRQMTTKNEDTGLYPFMEVATRSNGSLKALYNFTINSDMGLLFPV